MKALVVCAAPVRGTTDLVKQLARGADLVIAVDGGGAVCIAAGVAPDVVLGDFDSLAPAELRALEAAGARVVRFPAEKDASDLDLALDEARALGATEVVITAAVSGRLDHTLATLATAMRPRDLVVDLAEPELSGWILDGRSRSSLSLHGVASTVSLVALGGAAVASVTGTRWELDAVTLSPDSTMGLSNRIASDAGASVRVKDGTLLVLSPSEGDRPPARRV